MNTSDVARLVQHLAPGATVLHCRALLGGVSSITHAIGYRTIDGIETQLVVKRLGPHLASRDPSGLAREARMLGLARAAGIPGPACIVFDGEGEILDEPCLVIEYIDGQAAFAPPDPTAYARQAATVLSAIHALDASAAPFLERTDLPPSSLANAQASLEPNLARAAERVLAWQAWEDGRLAIRHGDFWPGNLLWRHDRLVAVLDWEDAQLGDPLFDLAISRLDLLWLFGSEAADAFTESYARASAVDQTRLAYWDLRAALRPDNQLPIWATAYADVGRPDVTAEHMEALRVRFAEQALDALR